MSDTFKNYIFLLLLGGAFLLTACTSQDGQQEQAAFEDNIPTLDMIDSTTYAFGTIREGDIVEHEFRFKNGGQFPLVISNVTASCGCTIPEWPREPIAPAAESSIKVLFNSKGKPGSQNKTITVYANTEPATSQLSIQGIVEPVADSTASSL